LRRPARRGDALSVAANDQLAGLRLGGIHDPAILATFNANVLITSAFPPGGLDGPNDTGQRTNAGGRWDVKPIEISDDGI
jgi:hypothetical protein